MTSESTTDHCVALIDIGNTRMKIGWLNRASGQREQAALALEHQNTQQLDAWFRQQNVRPDRAIGVSVAGNQKAQAIETFFSRNFNVSVRWLGSQPRAAGILNHYTRPAQLGADRWIAMVGLSQVQPDSTVPLLLASFGTATTLDTLCPARLAAAQPGGEPFRPDLDASTRWVYEGGMILPGPGLMRASLATNTAQLPEANGSTTAFPTDTHRAITTGIAASQAGALIRQWLAILQRYGVAPCVYGTGGGWPAVQDEVQALLATVQKLQQAPEQAVHYLASPILDGLARMAESL